MIQNDKKILPAHELAQAGAEQGADAFSYYGKRKNKIKVNPRDE